MSENPTGTMSEREVRSEYLRLKEEHEKMYVALSDKNGKLRELEKQRDAAEQCFIKAREENSGQEQEIADLTNELVVTRDKLKALERTAVKADELVTFFWRGVWTGAITSVIIGMAVGFVLGVSWAYLCQ